MRKTDADQPCARGYTLVEVVVAVLVFAVGGVALAGSSAVIGRAIRQNGIRERAARVAASRLAIIGANCRSATSGRESAGQILSEWTVSLDSSRVTAVESVTYPAGRAPRTDSYRMVVGCP